jgi:hypothetical protein
MAKRGVKNKKKSVFNNTCAVYVGTMITVVHRKLADLYTYTQNTNVRACKDYILFCRMGFGHDNIMWFIIEISRPYYTAGKTMLLKTRIREYAYSILCMYCILV